LSETGFSVAMVLGAIVSVQCGGAIATEIFDRIGPEGLRDGKKARTARVRASGGVRGGRSASGGVRHRFMTDFERSENCTVRNPRYTQVSNRADF
jgi:hypothetical protein